MPFLEPTEERSHIEKHVRSLGQEWAPVGDLEEVLSEYVYPYLSKDTVAVEIGVGGGRVAALVAPLVRRLHCIDLSPEMLARAREKLAGANNVDFLLVDEPQLPHEWSDGIDFVYSFDVMVHLDLKTIWAYFGECARVLRPGGLVMAHTTNLTTDRGFERFARLPARPFVGQHQYVTPEAIHVLLERSGLEYVKGSEPRGDNLYLNRDYIVIARKQLRAAT
jgi:SAM-dependent methyltransferase